MSAIWCLVAVFVTICHLANAGKLTRQCMASKGRCTRNKDSTCESNFGSGWERNGSCCRGRQCCVFQCEDIPTDSLKNGSVIVTERNTGSTANFSCDAGLSLVGRQSIICTASGWNGNIPQCINIVCPETVAFFRGSKYIFTCVGARWADSEANCKVHGGHLTSVETDDENAFLLDVIKLMLNKPVIGARDANFWIGLKYNDNAKSYTWLDGKPLNYSNWYQGPPQQPDRKQWSGNMWGANCALIHRDYALKWGDEHCSQNFKSVCEI
ncbi:C-type lectin domain family 4 member A-like [Mytilus edulis]|uniref:C-type lectin domain family 4 member A-like n=1 Tax=Mytilus edulis TaxID=6550 RepID=UPI0039F11563